MQIKQTLVKLLLILLPVAAASQSTYLPQDDKAEILMERMEIKARSDSFFNFSKTKPFTRQHTVSAVSNYLQKYGNNSLSKTDRYNAERVMLNNLEYVPEADRGKYNSKKPVLNHFYKTPANLYEVHVKDFDLVINPAEVFDFFSGQEPRQVASAIQLGWRTGTKMIRHELLLGEIRTAKVASRQTGAADIHLSGNANRDRPLARIENVKL